MARKNSQPGQGERFEGQASDVIAIDEKQENDLGQDTCDTYPKADFLPISLFL